MNQPQSFLGGPSYHVPPTPPSQTYEPRAPYAQPVAPGPANNLPVLSVARPNTLTLTKPLLAALNLRGGSFIHLVVPVQRGGAWYLDTNPKPGVGNAIPKSGRAMLRIPPIHTYHFQQSKPTFEARGRGKLVGLSTSNTLAQRLHFILGEEVEGHRGYYRLARLIRGL